MDLARSAEAAALAVKVLAESISGMPVIPLSRAGLRDDFRKDGRSIAVTEFASSHLSPARGIGLARISEEVESISKELCRGLNARDILDATLERVM
jgi:hypothetical protein